MADRIMGLLCSLDAHEDCVTTCDCDCHLAPPVPAEGDFVDFLEEVWGSNIYSNGKVSVNGQPMEWAHFVGRYYQAHDPDVTPVELEIMAAIGWAVLSRPTWDSTAVREEAHIGRHQKREILQEAQQERYNGHLAKCCSHRGCSRGLDFCPGMSEENGCNCGEPSYGEPYGLPGMQADPYGDGSADPLPRSWDSEDDEDYF